MNNAQPLTTRLCIGYGIGTIGISILLNTITTFFPTLMATVLGQSTALAGLLLTGSKLYDMAADMVIGTMSDRTRSRWGRRKPYMFAGLLISVVSLLMIFLPPAVVGATLVLYMALALVIYSTGYSLFAIPYIAMAGEMTDDYHERTRLFSFRVFCMSIGQILSVAGVAALIDIGGGGRSGYALMGSAMAALVGLSMALCLIGVRTARAVERVKPPVDMPLGRRIALLTSNRPLLDLMGAKFLQYISIAVFSGVKVLFLLNVLGVGYAGVIHLALAQNIAGALSTPLWAMVGKRIGKRPTYLIGVTILALTYMSWAVAEPGIAMPEIWLRGALAGIGGNCMVLMSISMLPDVMEYDRIRSGGLRREGIFSGFYAIVEKFGYAIGPAVSGVVLAVAGYVPTTNGALIQQSAEVLRGLYIAAAGIPAALLVFSAILIWRYQLTEEKLRATRAVE